MKTILTILFICIASCCNAQFLDKLGDKAVNAAERTVERRVETETRKSTDRVLDTIVDSQKKEKKKKSKKKSSGKNIIGGDPIEDNSNTSSTQNSDTTENPKDED